MDYEASMHKVLERLLYDKRAEPRELPLSLLKDITNDFSDSRIIGEYGYYVVYKGVLFNGEVAVKRMSQTAHTAEERFENELGCLMRMTAKHKNIVRFLGYHRAADMQGTMKKSYEARLGMADEREMLLCFEYPSGGKLDGYITDASRGLGWGTRYKIIQGICEGLLYLHQNFTVHLDLKPASIWLYKEKKPKIHGFYASRHLEEKQINVKGQDIFGTQEYMAPEVTKHGAVTLKADIYSLGVLIKEILGGSRHYLVENLLTRWADRLGTSLEDTRLEKIRLCAKIAEICLEYYPDIRPGAERIINIINFGFHTASPQTTELNILERVLAGFEEPRHLDLLLLQNITKNFSEQSKIGVGGCGEVYKGTLLNGDVAVKRLFKIRTIKDKMFHREVKSLIMARHENIVRFLGYCSFTEEHALPFEGGTIMVDIRERLLCFEYISNGNLENYLTDELRGLEWHTRYEIIVGICKGLLYLHKEKAIVHMDLKPANILLDDLMVPKITDFGLSRLENNSQAATTSRLMSPGYCAPEYFLEGISSSKSDIYSLGVMVIELVTGCKKEPDLTKVLRRWRYRWIQTSKHTPLGYQQVTKCLDLAQRCIQINPIVRPDIVYIMDELNAIESKGGQFQEIPCLDDMLGVEPLEIHFPFELDPHISHLIELTNDTDDYIAFMMKATICCLEPDKGIVPPQSKCSVTTKMQAQVKEYKLPNHHKEKVTVQSTIVDGGLAAMDITGDLFIEKEGTVVDEVNVMVIFYEQPPPPPDMATWDGYIFGPPPLPPPPLAVDTSEPSPPPSPRAVDTSEPSPPPSPRAVDTSDYFFGPPRP